MVQLKEYHRLGQSNAPYNIDGPGASIDFVQLSTTYQSAIGTTYHYLDAQIGKNFHAGSRTMKSELTFSASNTEKILVNVWEL